VGASALWQLSSASALVLLVALPLLPADYRVERVDDHGVATVHLVDEVRAIEVTVVPSIGNRAIAMTVHGKNVLFFPDRPLSEIKSKPGLNGIPFLAPWANRLDEQGFWVDGKHFLLNRELANYGSDNNGLPIHGLLSSSDRWEIMEAKADATSAFLTSRLEFWKYPEFMAQWPFAQEYEMTYRLAGGQLQVSTTIRNLSAAAIPVSIGFHPYYRLPGSVRDDWTLSMPASRQVIADSRLIPTGETKASDLPYPLPLKGHFLDTGFTDMARDSQGRAHFRIQSGAEQLEITFGPNYPVTVIFSPPPRGNFRPEFICIEPMAGLTDALNLHHRGLYDSLQTIVPGESWTESFWIRPSGI
jgi:aldose 1-epimerase